MSILAPCLLEPLPASPIPRRQRQPARRPKTRSPATIVVFEDEPSTYHRESTQNTGIARSPCRPSPTHEPSMIKAIRSDAASTSATTGALSVKPPQRKLKEATTADANLQAKSTAARPSPGSSHPSSPQRCQALAPSSTGQSLLQSDFRAPKTTTRQKQSSPAAKIPNGTSQLQISPRFAGRRPLGQTPEPAWSNAWNQQTSTIDRWGAGDGKENVPPDQADDRSDYLDKKPIAPQRQCLKVRQKETVSTPGTMVVTKDADFDSKARGAASPLADTTTPAILALARQDKSKTALMTKASKLLLVTLCNKLLLSCDVPRPFPSTLFLLPQLLSHFSPMLEHFCQQRFRVLDARTPIPGRNLVVQVSPMADQSAHFFDLALMDCFLVFGRRLLHWLCLVRSSENS